jgi:hypothetical protein
MSFKFEKPTVQPSRVTKPAILAALREFHASEGGDVTSSRWDSWDKRPITSQSISAIFGSWPKALEDAGIRPTSYKARDPKGMIDLFKKCWEQNKAPPTWKHLDQFLELEKSRYRSISFRRYFGSRELLIERIVQHQEGKISDAQLYTQHRKIYRKATISTKLRTQVFNRDGNRCVVCGRSPAKDNNVTLHAHHIVPEKAGGPTCLENLQTRCHECHEGHHGILNSGARK